VTRCAAVAATAAITAAASAAVIAATAAAKIIVKIAAPPAIAMPSPVFHDQIPILEPGVNHPAGTIMQVFSANENADANQIETTSLNALVFSR
jgi:hypothetical protein